MSRLTWNSIKQIIGFAFIRGIGISFFLLFLAFLGYILFNGFFHYNNETSQTLDFYRPIIYFGNQPISFLVNQDNRVDVLGMEQIEKIYTGQYRQWADVNGSLTPIELFHYSALEPKTSIAIQYFLTNGVSSVPISNVRSLTRKQKAFSPEQNALILLTGKDCFISKDVLKKEHLKRVMIKPYCLASLSENSPISLTSKELQTLFQTKKISVNGQVWHLFLSQKMLHYLKKYGYRLNPSGMELFWQWRHFFVWSSQNSLANLKLAQQKTLFIIPYTQYRRYPQFSLIQEKQGHWGTNLQFSFLWKNPVNSGKYGGIGPILLNTIFLIIFTLLLSTPFSLLTALYLSEYSKKAKLLYWIRLSISTLSGLPSILFGLFGYLLFVHYFHLGVGLFSGALTLTIMIIPTMINIFEQAILSVPKADKEGSYALGATQLQTIFFIVLPTALPGLVTGLILSVGRIIGETAALIFTMGTGFTLIHNLSMPSSSLTVYLYELITQGISYQKAFACAAILIILVFFINSFARVLVKIVVKRRREI